MSLTSYRAAPPRAMYLDLPSCQGYGERAVTACVLHFFLRVALTWRRPTLQRLRTQYHWR